MALCCAQAVQPLGISAGVCRSGQVVLFCPHANPPLLHSSKSMQAYEKHEDFQVARLMHKHLSVVVVEISITIVITHRIAGPDSVMPTRGNRVTTRCNATPADRIVDRLVHKRLADSG